MRDRIRDFIKFEILWNLPGLHWHRYYYRVIGYALGGAGVGLMVDELIHGPFTLTPSNHEFWGLIMVIAGAVFTTRKPHGKD